MQEGSVFRGTYDFETPEFDWGVDYARPHIPPQDLIIYEEDVSPFPSASSRITPPSLGTDYKVGC